MEEIAFVKFRIDLNLFANEKLLKTLMKFFLNHILNFRYCFDYNIVGFCNFYDNLYDQN
ncbi:MAG: hypothetical protein CM15mP92_0660 [Halieaceae bacterium]|nr:MAG: hypothetical protein CM15mP92_0660 [Halieaceae bacterium]